jgi:polysaccharide export outer membrane protein
MNGRKLMTLTLLLVLAGASIAQEQSKQFTIASASLKSGVASQVNNRSYVIGPEDVLAINVWKEPEISRTLPVRPDGKISLPLVGDITATGMTPEQLQAILESKLRSFIASPEVTVIVQEIKSEKVNIVGQVYKPGSYLIAKPTTVLDVIAMAGGFRDFAKSKKVYVLRIENGRAKRYPFNYKDVIKGRKLAQNILLQPRDTIVVP